MEETNPLRECDLLMTRRQLFGRTALGLGTAAMAQLFGPRLIGAEGQDTDGMHHAAHGQRRVVGGTG